MGLAQFFDISLDRANDLYTWGWRLSVFGAALTMIGVAALWMGTRVRDRDFETQMTSVNLTSSQALERAGLLERDAATIRERAANAELKLEELRKQVGPRHLKTREFVDALAGKPKLPVEIMFLKDDADAFALSLEIRSALRVAEWEVHEPIPIPPTAFPQLSTLPTTMAVGGQPSGVTVVVNSVTPEEFAASTTLFMGNKAVTMTPWLAIQNALLASLGAVNGSGGGKAGPEPGTLRIVIGSKPNL
jgi:hypothetical protein